MGRRGPEISWEKRLGIAAAAVAVLSAPFIVFGPINTWWPEEKKVVSDPPPDIVVENMQSGPVLAKSPPEQNGAAILESVPPAPGKICPSERFTAVEGAWKGIVTCNGSQFGFSLQMSFGSARQLRGELGYQRAAEDNVSRGSDLWLHLAGDYDEQGAQFRLSDPGYDLATGYPVVDLTLRGNDIKAERISGRAFDRQGGSNSCGAWSATRPKEDFGSRGRVIISFNRRQSAPRAFDPNDC